MYERECETQMSNVMRTNHTFQFRLSLVQSVLRTQVMKLLTYLAQGDNHQCILLKLVRSSIQTPKCPSLESFM